MTELKILKVSALPEVCEPSAVYFVLNLDNTCSAYVTDKQGTPKAVRTPFGNLLSSIPVNLNEGTGAKQVLYTVPSLHRAVITRVDMDGLSNLPTITEFTMGWNTAANNTLDAFHLSDLITNVSAFGSIIVQPNSWLVGTAGQSLGLAVSTPEGTALTGRVNVFGYLTDASGVPLG